MSKRIVLNLLLIFVSAVTCANAQKARAPEKDSPERAAILNALRAPVVKALKQKVSFAADKFKVQGDWAFFGGQLRNADGSGEPDWKKTEYQQQIDNEVFDNNVFGLLKKSAGKWRVVTYAIGCTDVCYLGWDKEYKAPEAIFK